MKRPHGHLHKYTASTALRNLHRGTLPTYTINPYREPLFSLSLVHPL